jgi:hypothetical protein
MVLARLMNPEHIVEQQFPAISWRKPFVRPPRRTDHDCPQFADLGVHAEGPVGLSSAKAGIVRAGSAGRVVRNT